MPREPPFYRQTVTDPHDQRARHPIRSPGRREMSRAGLVRGYRGRKRAKIDWEDWAIPAIWSCQAGGSPGVESGVLGDHFTAGFSSPSQAALRQERKTRLIELLESLDRRVALKVIPSRGPDDSRRLERFQREARAAAGLHHTHIVPVYDVGHDGGFHYYAVNNRRSRGEISAA